MKADDTSIFERGRHAAARFTPWQFGCVLALFVLALFPDVVSGTKSFFYRDFGVWAYPDAAYHRDCFWRGELPLWNPYSNCGIPFLAQWNTITLYPLSLIYLLLPLPWSLSVFCLAHLWLAGMGMYLLAHRWTNDRFAASVAGIAYALNGLTLHSLMWPNNIAALGWLPIVLLFVERARQTGGRWVVFAAIAGANQMLAGAPEIILLTWFAAAVLAAADMIGERQRARSEALRFGCIAAVVAALASAQLLPFMELMRISQRSAAFGDSTWSMPAWGWANFLVPLFHQSKSVVGVYSQDDQQWTSSYYVGIGVIALAALAIFKVRTRRVWILAGFGLFGVLMSMGEHTFLYRTLKTVLPQMGFARFPIKFVVLAILAFPLLAAYAARECRTAIDRTQRPARVISRVLLALLIAVAGIIWVSHREPVLNEDWRVTLSSGVTRCLFLALILGALSLLSRWGSDRSRWWLQWSVILLIGSDAATHAPRQNPTIASEVLKPGVAELTAMPGLGGGRAMVSPVMQDFMDHAATANLLQYYLGQRATLFANCNLIDRIPKTSGLYSLYLREEAVVRSAFTQLTNQFPSGLADFLGVRRISASNETFGWTTRPTALPMITAGQKPILAHAAATLTALIDPRFDSRSIVYLPAEIGGSIRSTERSEARIESTHVSAHRIEAVVNSRTPVLVVAAQAFSPLWRCLVNGREVPLLRANHAFQAIETPGGRNLVAFVYRDRQFHFGLLVSLLALVWCMSQRRVSSRRTVVGS